MSDTPAPAATAPTVTTRHLLVEIVAVAVLYFVAARLGLLLAMPGGHVTPVWPPSGIALAAVLLLGRRVWPAIWIGSVFANLIDFLAGAQGLTTGAGVSGMLGLGATLTALLGARLTARYIARSEPLGSVREVGALLILGGIVSCGLSATLGVTTLCVSGTTAWAAYGATWWT